MKLVNLGSRLDASSCVAVELLSIDWISEFQFYESDLHCLLENASNGSYLYNSMSSRKYTSRFQHPSNNNKCQHFTLVKNVAKGDTFPVGNLSRGHFNVGFNFH